MLFFRLFSVPLWCGLVIATQPLLGQDKIVRKSGPVQMGQITGMSANGLQIQVDISGSKVNLTVPLQDILNAEWQQPPAAYAQAQGLTDPAAIVGKLESLVNQYKGLPSDWVVDAMSELADAYTTQNQLDKAGAIYSDIARLYPGSPYLIKANVGKAKGALKAGKPDEALALLDPLIAEANKRVAPTAAEARLYGEAFLVKGQALEAKNDLPGALESYVTVEIAFYQNEDVMKEALAAANRLRADNKNLTVE